MEKLIKRLKKDHPDLVFSPGQSHCWLPEQSQIYYAAETANRSHSTEGLLHELGHAHLKHKGYVSDLELLKKEVDAWQEALRLAKLYDVAFDENHMQDCLDTYRDWLYKRSICPQCGTKSLQQDDYVHYRCFNCHTTWRVTPSRFCRAYRRSKNVQQPTAVFHTDIEQ